MDITPYLQRFTPVKRKLTLPDGTILRLLNEDDPDLEKISKAQDLAYFPKVYASGNIEVGGREYEYIHYEHIDGESLCDRLNYGGYFPWGKFCARMNTVEAETNSVGLDLEIFLTYMIVYNGEGDTVRFTGFGVLECPYHDKPFSNQMIESFSLIADIEFIRDNLHIPWDKERLCAGYEFGEHVDALLELALPENDSNWSWDTISRYVALDLVHRHPDWPWEVELLSINVNITLEDVRKIGIEKMWVWEDLTQFVPASDIVENLNDPNCPWHKPSIGKNKHVTYEHLRDGGFIADLDTARVQDEILACKGDHLPIDYVRKHTGSQFCTSTLSGNPGIHPLDYKLLINKGTEDWMWNKCHLFTVIPFDVLCRYPFILPGDQSPLSHNPTAPIDRYAEYPGHTDIVDYEDVSRYVDISYIREHPSYKWDKQELSRNPGITLEDVDALQLPNATHEWNWYLLSQTIPMDVIRTNTHREWDLWGLSHHPQLSQEDVSFLHLPNAIRKWDRNCLRDRNLRAE